MRLRSSRTCANPCPNCGGCLPFEDDTVRVCCCGSKWGPLTELIRLLDELLSDPPPADEPVPALLPGLPDSPDKIDEERT